MAAGMIQGLEEGAATPAASLRGGERDTPPCIPQPTPSPRLRVCEPGRHPKNTRSSALHANGSAREVPLQLKHKEH